MTKHRHTTLYVLADGTHADPDEVSAGKDGVLRHKNGMAVALREGGAPLTVGAAATEGGNVAAAKAAFDRHADPDQPKAEARQALAPEPKAKEEKPDADPKAYKTRESKAG